MPSIAWAVVILRILWLVPLQHHVHAQGNLTSFTAGPQLNDGYATIEYLPSSLDKCNTTADTSCNNVWWLDDARQGHCTMGKGTSLKFTFQGSDVEFSGQKYIKGARGTFTVDGSTYQNILDPRIHHTIQVYYNGDDFVETGDNRKWMCLNRILYRPSTEKMSSKGLSTGAIAGTVVGAALGGVVLSSLFFIWYQRRRSTPSQAESPEESLLLSEISNVPEPSTLPTVTPVLLSSSEGLGRRVFTRKEQPPQYSQTNGT
ncbi:hypothetical protein DL96DRAFT_1620507 [Flagelloscypha sp. PMI_526]|nr:hypothetical protein DL96DRAFT_1620507 [Flagelloscypha sp. PMI_526]